MLSLRKTPRQPGPSAAAHQSLHSSSEKSHWRLPHGIAGLAVNEDCSSPSQPPIWEDVIVQVRLMSGSAGQASLCITACVMQGSAWDCDLASAGIWIWQMLGSRSGKPVHHRLMLPAGSGCVLLSNAVCQTCVDLCLLEGNSLSSAHHCCMMLTLSATMIVASPQHHTMAINISMCTRGRVAES
jgi:hypothetical protein